MPGVSSEMARLPKVKEMRRLGAIVLLVLPLMLAFALPARAAPLRVSVSAKSQSRAIAFAVKTSRPSSVKITIYRANTLVRKLTARKASGAYRVVWNARDAAGRQVSKGTYGYKVSAATSSARKTVNGRARVIGEPSPAKATVKRWVGFYQPGAPERIEPLKNLESQVGTHAAVVNFFVGDDETFPASRVGNLAAHGSIPLITLEFWSLSRGGLSAITNGSRDAYIAAFARGAKDAGGTIWLRPFHEMNGYWYPWGGTVGSNSAEQLVAAWRHVHDIFVAEGAINVRFVWCPNNKSYPNSDANAIEGYYPGDAYVDYVAVDGYNFGESKPTSRWTTFTSAFDDAYRRVTALANKPLFIAETGCSNVGGDKAAWVSDMFKQIRTKYTKVQGVCWFNVNKETDWRVDSSQASLTAFKTGLATGY